ncbi:MAG: hypothetical protein Q4F29_01095 [Lachnospiraceae bacterium]|nr:hypothetical protein [Lachnospiraceae bacterium]
MILMKNKYKIEGTDAVEIERKFPQHFCSERAEKGLKKQLKKQLEKIRKKMKKTVDIC